MVIILSSVTAGWPLPLADNACSNGEIAEKKGDSMMQLHVRYAPLSRSSCWCKGPYIRYIECPAQSSPPPLPPFRAASCPFLQLASANMSLPSRPSMDMSHISHQKLQAMSNALHTLVRAHVSGLPETERLFSEAAAQLCGHGVHVTKNTSG